LPEARHETRQAILIFMEYFIYDELFLYMRSKFVRGLFLSIMGRKNMREERRGKGRDKERSFESDFSSFSNFNPRPREMHQAKCADCGSDCEVPFKPIEGRPVYCRNCFAKHRPQRF